jgi:hypothetical protein
MPSSLCYSYLLFPLTSVGPDVYGVLVPLVRTRSVACRRMLGSRLMQKADFETAFETRALELIKLRFKESELHHCDVMLKDIQVRNNFLLSLFHLAALDPVVATGRSARGAWDALKVVHSLCTQCGALIARAHSICYETPCILTLSSQCMPRTVVC